MSFCVGVGFYMVSPLNILLWVPFCGWFGGWFLEAPLNSIHLFTSNFHFISFHFILKYLYRYKFHIFIHVFQTDLLKNNIK